MVDVPQFTAGWDQDCCYTDQTASRDCRVLFLSSSQALHPITQVTAFHRIQSRQITIYIFCCCCLKMYFSMIVFFPLHLYHDSLLVFF
ncbi:hypothetical protein J4Q44_G00339580 [Coregonus suidteri]|uniref:Uncharacterized protein n=1 Tax=Coregonus suidteri TaxID=861788 RepID=A0AAN8L2J0_9TELE